MWGFRIAGIWISEAVFSPVHGVEQDHGKVLQKVR